MVLIPLVTQRSIQQRLLSGSAWALVVRIGSMLLGMVISALLARLLVPDQLGAYFLLLSVVTIFATLARLGMNQVIVRYVAEALAVQERRQTVKAIKLVFGYTVLGTLVVAVVMWLGGEPLARIVFQAPGMATLIQLSIVWMAGLAFLLLLGETFRGFHDIRAAALCNGVAVNAFSVVPLLVLMLG
ncbi:MAG: oligosaccharide flippase family protein, partial [Chloroflexota bacterium]|nr:oligosaccharide flippase family protein [Chloroflexota bacterium]